MHASHQMAFVIKRSQVVEELGKSPCQRWGLFNLELYIDHIGDGIYQVVWGGTDEISIRRLVPQFVLVFGLFWVFDKRLSHFKYNVGAVVVSISDKLSDGRLSGPMQ